MSESIHKDFYNCSISELEKQLQTNLGEGLSSAEAKCRFEQNGANEFEKKKQKSLPARFLKAIQFMLSTNIGEVLVIFTAIVANWASPLLPIHIMDQSGDR
jgi:magnesium-transporting ATPase (P-type)